MPSRSSEGLNRSLLRMCCFAHFQDSLAHIARSMTREMVTALVNETVWTHYSGRPPLVLYVRIPCTKPYPGKYPS